MWKSSTWSHGDIGDVSSWVHYWNLDGKSKLRIAAFTTERVIEDRKAIEQSMCASKWSHLQQLKFLKLGPQPTVNILIDLDCADLHFSFWDIQGAPRQLVVWLTPLGWKHIGPAGNSKQINISTNFAYTYFLQVKQIRKN